MRIPGIGLTCLAVTALAMPGAIAESPSPHANLAPSPYVGMESRRVTSLSDQQIDDLTSGRGMGLALPAELNGYPGPRHVLDLSDHLGLSPEQKTATARLFDGVQTEAIAIGISITADEAALDRLFAMHRATADGVDALTARIAAAQGRLRAVHLRAHLRMMDLLSPDQVALYATARGYGHAGKSH